MLLLKDPLRVTPDDPQLKRLIEAERVRMLFGAALPVELVSSVFAIALAALIGAQVGWLRAVAWAIFCLVVTGVRLGVYRAYVRSQKRDHPRWLTSMVVMSGMLGGTWGLGSAWLLPVNDLNVSAVIVGSLIGASAICTFALQADPRPNRVLNISMLLPCAVMLFTRQDAYGVFGGCGLLTLMGIMLLEGERSARRITELLWLRFTTDRIAQERAEALKLAQRHSAVKDQFLATMSHEMRTPLHGILGLARLVGQKLPPRPGVLNESREHLALIERSGEHLLGIISDVLDFSRIEAGKLQIDQAPFDLHAVVDDVLSLLAVTAAEKGLPLRRDIQLNSPCMVFGDAARLRQVLHNLVGNAIKFTDMGHVKVTVQRHHCDDEGPDSPCAKRVVFRIEDTGIGIPPDQQAMVFDAFHQADGSFVRKHRGTGLGLTISREIARAMQGDILCESTAGQGSVFTLNVPLPRITNSEPTRFLATRPSSLMDQLDDGGFSGHVLLAEDNPVNALVAQAILSKLGLQVTHVEDGQQALALLSQPHGIDLVLMDCQMPVLDGIEATRRLRCIEQEQGRPGVPVIALTANVMSQDRDRCRAAGMDDHLAKPFTQEDLSAMLKAHLHAERQASFTA
ncbi:ATP-binding protein [Aquabacterium sp.]|uniref:ATP-binding protein n=1 Tax=Aquabacterium sp. TaxID=1872578 RepID=UPI003D6CE35E